MHRQRTMKQQQHTSFFKVALIMYGLSWVLLMFTSCGSAVGFHDATNQPPGFSESEQQHQMSEDAEEVYFLPFLNREKSSYTNFVGNGLAHAEDENVKDEGEG